ncbi:ankyrin repeat-containing domain protein [Mycena olivaceomarginata]|nr:ankyrin repeat-containing domain protein [Mycena olivaceomarginata]
MSRDPGTMHVHGGFGGPGGEGYGQGTGGPGGIGLGPTLYMERVENLNIGGQKEAEIWYIFVLPLEVYPDLLTQRDQMEDTKRRTIIEWLSPLNFFLRQQDISKTHQQGTGEWLLDDPEFKGLEIKSWTSSMVLWNTNLSSLVVDHLTDQSKNKNYWSGMHLFQPQGDSDTNPGQSACQDSGDSLSGKNLLIYIILDGVDEYPAEWWSQLAKALTNLGPLKPVGYVEAPYCSNQAVLNLVTLEIRANDKDILSYVDTQVQESERLSELTADKPELHGEISSKICSSVEGMFLLAKLHIEALSKTATIKARTRDHNFFNIANIVLVHAQWCEGQLRDEILGFLREARKWQEHEVEIGWQDPPWSFDDWPHSPSLYGLLPQQILEGDMEMHSRQQPGGHDKIVQVLLDKGADVNAQGGVWKIHAAASGGHDKIVQGGRYGNALQAAASGGHDKIVQVLLDKGANVNAQGGRYGNALHAAASGGHDKIVQGGSYGNALRAAASGGHDKIVQMLLDKGANVNAQGGRYGNALQAAANEDHDKIVQVLLEKGMNAQQLHVGNALSILAFVGHHKAIEVLLDKGVDVNAQGGKYGNALQAAAHNGKANIVQLLLNKGADINAQGGEYGNALQAAACGAYQICHSIVWVLLRKGGHFGNALQAAAYKGKANIVQVLLHKGADINAQGGKYENALQAAANQGHRNIVQMLLDRGKIGMPLYHPILKTPLIQPIYNGDCQGNPSSSSISGSVLGSAPTSDPQNHTPPPLCL